MKNPRLPWPISSLNIPEAGSTLLSIAFRHDKRYGFKLNQQQDEGVYVFWVTISPGEFKKVESLTISSLAQIPDLIKTWTRHVRDELRTAIPAYQELDELRDILDRHAAEHVADPDKRFSSSEVEELKSKLDKLAERFDEMQQRNEITTQELSRLKEELTSLKSNLGSFPKGVWYKTAGAKIFSTIGTVLTSKEGRGVIAQEAKKLLGLDHS